MKFQVDQGAFAEAISWTARGLPARPSNPVLAGVTLRVVDNQLVMSGFDYETSSQTVLDITAEKGGEALVSGRLLAEICNSLPSSTIEFEEAGAKLEIACGSARFSMPLMPFEDYPDLPAMPSHVSGTVDPRSFAAAVAQVAVAASRDDLLPVLTGVNLEVEGSTISMFATDKYRLAFKELAWEPSKPDISFRALIPARTLSAAAKTFGALNSPVTIALSREDEADTIGLSADRWTTTTRLIDGEFPKVRSLFPQDEVSCLVSTAEISEKVKRVALVAERNRPIALSFDQDTLTVEAGFSGDTQAREVIDCTYAGEPAQVGYNAAYLVDGLAAMGSAHLLFGVNKPGKPSTLIPADANGEPTADQYRYVLMPLRIMR